MTLDEINKEAAKHGYRLQKIPDYDCSDMNRHSINRSTAVITCRARFVTEKLQILQIDYR